MRKSLPLTTKFILVISFLGLVPVLGVAVNSYGQALSRHAAAQMDTAMQGSQYLERINGLVYAAVMESRGIYMSQSWNVAEPFAKGLLQRLAEIDATTSLWKGRAIESESGRIADLAQGIAKFVDFRKELVRLAQGDIAAARVFGDNDANRKIRSTLNDKLVELDKAYVTHVEIAKEEVRRVESFNQLTLWALAILAAFAVTAGLMFVIRGLSRPLKAIRDAMLRLARGTHDIDVPGVERTDEIGEMAGAVMIFRNAAVANARLEEQAIQQRQQAEEERSARDAEREEQARQSHLAVATIGAGLEHLARGDLTFRVDTELSGESDKLRLDFNLSAGQLSESIEAIAATTNVIHSGTDEIRRSTNDLSQRTEQQAASLEETAVALDEITATVQRTAEGAEQARTVVSAAKADAETSGDVVRRAIEAMGGIEKSARQISQIIGVIDEIAFQTNLLALNAGVEAARAGEAGRGFAVVATEVRALAQRSAEAAKEIRTLISASAVQVGEGVDLVAETGRALERIMAQVVEINAVVSDISASSREQATGLQEVNTAVNQMDQITQKNAAIVDQSMAATHSLANEAEELARLVASFKIEAMSDRAPRFAAPTAPRQRPALREIAT
jgi:methyl-accepting chemotaxis protein